MLKTKGFTLIELLAVIVILAIILAIVIPNVFKIVSNSKLEAHIVNREIIIKAARNYMSTNPDALPLEVGESVEITLSFLKENNFMKNLKDPNDANHNCNGYVIVSKITEFNYEYTSYINCLSDIGNKTDDQLIAHWKLDGNAFDSSGNGLNCNIIGSPVISDGIIKESYTFANVGNYLDCGYISNRVNLTGDITISYWVKSIDLPTARYGILETSYGAEIALNITATGGLQWYQGTAGISANPYECLSTTGQVFYPNKWVFVTQIRKTQNKKAIFYVNGVFNREVDYIYNPVPATSAPLRIGRSYAGTLNGQLDDIHIYGRILAADEIKFNYELGKR